MWSLDWKHCGAGGRELWSSALYCCRALIRVLWSRDFSLVEPVRCGAGTLVPADEDRRHAVSAGTEVPAPHLHSGSTSTLRPYIYTPALHLYSPIQKIRRPRAPGPGLQSDPRDARARRTRGAG